MRNLVIFIFYSLALLFVGRQLLFLPAITVHPPASAKDVEQIREVVVTFLKTQKGSYSIFYEDIKSGERFGIQENTVLTAASLNKLGVVGYLYHQAGKKEVDLGETIVIQPEDVQNYGTGSLRYEEAGKPYSLKYLTQLALQKSDNTAAHVLNIRMGEENIQYYVTILGMGATDQVNNETSAHNVGYFFEQLYKNNITSPDLTQELLGYMKDTDFEDRIPKYLPKTVTVYHKTGDGVGFIHDGGIVDDGKAPFVLVVMTQNVSDENNAKDTIGKIAKLIYDDRKGN